MARMPTRHRGPMGARDAAEAAFKSATTRQAVPVAKAPAALPGVREQVTLRIDQDVLDAFRQEGAGWQDRINDALRQALKPRG
jgi:uncharacterized protein (DUF4415 family)